MAYEQKEGDIAIFLVKEKKGEKHPDWTGKALIDGKERDVSLWVKSDTMLAGAIKDKWKPDFEQAKQVAQPETQGAVDELEDIIPFMRYQHGILA